MTLRIKYTGADFSGSGLPKLRRTRFGFDADSLAALYLLQDGSAGAPYTGVVVDSSGKGKNASLLTASQPPVRQSYGMGLPYGGGLIAPIVAVAPYTILFVARQSVGNAPRTDVPYPGFHTHTGGLQGINYGAGSALTVNMDISGATNRLPIGLFATSAVFSGSVLKSAAPIPAVNEQSVFGAGYAVDSTTDRLDFRSTPGAVFRTDIAAVNNIARNATGNHVFGLLNAGGAGIPTGDLLLAAIYNRALTAAELDTELANAKAVCSARPGVVMI
jgi:hypothetical protein